MRGAAVDTVVEIETPERVQISYRLAGPVQRGAAYVLDLLARGLVLGVALFWAALGGSLDGLGAGVWALLLFVVEWGYYVASETWYHGQSPGKRLLRLRVVRSDGLPIGFGESCLRNVLRAADFVPSFYAVGVLVSSVDHRFRRLGDMAAGTLVICESTNAHWSPLLLSPPPTPQELAQLPHRLAVGREELLAIEALLRRGARLNPVREEELAELLASVLARRMGLRYQSATRFLALLHHRAVTGMV